MKLLANENFPLRSYNLLKNHQFDIIHIGIENPSVTDKEVIETATRENRVILTFDADYGTLVFLKKMRPPGVIYLRFKEFTADFPAFFLLQLFETNEFLFEGRFTVIDADGIIRQRLIE